MLSVKGQGWVREDPQRGLQTYLHVDLDWERDALLQLLRSLIEILAELPDGDSSLGRKRGK